MFGTAHSTAAARRPLPSDYAGLMIDELMEGRQEYLDTLERRIEE
jgi:hypothetical protein